MTKRFVILPFVIALAVFSLSACQESTSLQADGDIEQETLAGDTDGTDLDEKESDFPESEPEPADGDLDFDLIDEEMDEVEVDLEEEKEEETPPVIAFIITALTHCIQVDSTASPSERQAASELQSTLSEILSTFVPLCSKTGETLFGRIVIGAGESAQELGVDPSLEDLGEQGYLIRTVPPHLVIAGTPAAGTMYGVHRFLESVAGVRWYAPGVTHTPKRDAIPVPEEDRIVKPAFLWRNAYYTWPGADDAFRAHQTDNSGGKGPDDPYGQEYAFDGIAHTYFSFISPDEYFDEHPEYFSEIGGVRVREETQLCLSNPDVLEIVTEKMLARMAANPGARQHNFSQMDHYNYCECDQCRAINEQYGTTGGTQFWFINKVAERISEVYPDKLIGTLAYTFTEEPPQGMEMHPNTAVWLCHMYPSCDSHPIATCPLNADYKRRAMAWANIAPHLYVWHYITNFTHYYVPFPNFDAMAADMRFYHDIGVEGIFLQGMGQSGGGGEWSLLRPYYGMQLLWNPDRDPHAIIRDFLGGYYGPAADALEGYIQMLQNKVADEDIHMHLYTNPAQGYIDDAIIDAATAYFDEAEMQVADDPELLERVKVARLPLIYARMFPYAGNDLEGGRMHWLSDLATWSEVQEFFERMSAHGFQLVREAAGDRASMEMLYLLISSEPKIYTIENPELLIEIVPNMGARALRIIHKASGQCITAWNIKRGLFYPFNGGLEDRIGGSIPFGWVEPGAIKEQSELAFTTQQNTMNGFILKREIVLDASLPFFTVRTTVTNPSSGPLDCRLREHVEYDLGDVRTTRVAFTARSGEEIDQDMTAVVAGMREGVHFYDQNAPDGQWRLSGSKGLEIAQSFSDEQIDFTWIYAFPESLNEVETEVWVKSRTLEPGESFVFERSIEVREVE
jgi:hypothetical protein